MILNFILFKFSLGNNNTIEIKEKIEDDPRRRRPDITLAKNILNWEPKISLLNGLKLTVDYFRNELDRNENSQSNDQTKQSLYYFSSTEEAHLENVNEKNEL